MYEFIDTVYSNKSGKLQAMMSSFLGDMLIFHSVSSDQFSSLVVLRYLSFL